MRKSILIGVVALASCGGGRLPAVERLRSRASHDLDCPMSEIVAYDTGLGGWAAQGCGREISYVCSHGTCAREGEIRDVEAASAQEDATAWDVGPWVCTVHGASTEDARASMRWVGAHVDPLASCGTTSVRAVVEAQTGRVAALEIAGRDERCARAVFEGAIIGRASSAHRFECDRP